MAERKNEAAWMEKQQRWQIKVQKDGERKTFYSTTVGKKGKIEAEKKADAWLQTGLRNGSQRLKTLWGLFVEREKTIHGEKSDGYRKAECFGRLYIIPRLGHKRMDSITPQDWQDVIDFAFAQRDLAHKSLENIRGSITAFWKFCRRSQVNFCQPVDPLTIPRAAKRGEKKSLQENDIRILFTVDGYIHTGMRTRYYRAHYIHLWRFMVATGLRPGEAIGLTWSNLSGNVLTITRSINIHNVETQGKNDNARRQVVLPAIALKILDDQAAYLRRKGIVSTNIFPATDGGQAREDSMYGSWVKYRNALGITSCTPYEMRHSFVTLNPNIPDAILRPMIGHSTRMDTRRVYGHQTQNQLAEAAKLVDYNLADILSEPELDDDTTNSQTASGLQSGL